jgi:hypothetical protein
MANSNGWGDGAANNAIGWGQGANNAIGWGDIHADSWAGATDIVGITTPPVDPDAQAFITAAAITDPTQQAAINTLVVDLKADGTWSKMKAIYPFVGGTAASHKFNLKDPRDLDAAFRLVFNGGWTHSSTGALPNGTNAFADTKFNLTKFTAFTNASTGVYLRTNISQTSVDFGQGYANLGVQGVLLYPRYSSNSFAGCCIGNTFSAGTNTDSRGFYAVTRTGTTQNVRKRGTSTIDLTTTNLTDSLYSNLNIYLAASNELGTSVIAYSSREQAFAFMGDYLTSTEIDNFYTRVQNFNTALARQV